MCIDRFSIDISDEPERPIPGLRVPWAIFSPKPNSYGNLGPRFQASLLLREPLPPSWILNLPPDWLKITSAILDLENNRVYCSWNKSLLSFSAPDWLRPLWASYSGNKFRWICLARVKKRHKCQFVPRLLSMIVDLARWPSTVLARWPIVEIASSINLPLIMDTHFY